MYSFGKLARFLEIGMRSLAVGSPGTELEFAL